MSILSRIWNWNSAVTEKNFEGRPLLYRATQNTKEIVIEKAKVRFERRDKERLLHFVNTAKDGLDQFFAGIHPSMNIKTFQAGTNGETVSYCVEWTPEAEQRTFDHLSFGCEFSNEGEAENFTRILTAVSAELGEGVTTKSLDSAPGYMEVE